MRSSFLPSHSRSWLLICAFLATASVLTAAEILPKVPDAPIPKTDYWSILERRWQIIEPGVFTDGGAGYLGATVRISGTPVTLKPAIVIKTTGGATIRLQQVQKTDREELATFREPPKVVIVEGPIISIDRAQRTVTIKAVSTSFYQQ